MSFAQNFKNWIKKIWFPVFILIVILVYFLVDHNIAIYMLAAVIVVLSIQILYEIYRTQSLKGRIKRKPRQEDEALARDMKQDLNEIRNMLSELKKDKRASFLIIEDNGKYITYNPKLVNALKKLLLDNEYPQSDVNKALEKFNIRTKQEIRLIREELISRQKESNTKSKEE